MSLSYGARYTKECTFCVKNLRCEYKQDPLGIGDPRPRLSWKIFSTKTDIMQTAYQLLVASSPDLLFPDKADLWNSEKIFTDQSIHVEYDGKALKSRQKCFWTVKVWANDGIETTWSPSAYFETGLLNSSEWKSNWIKTSINFEDNSYPSPLFRKEFNIKKKVKSARLYCSSLGLYEFYLNKQKVGDELFTPGWTSFEKRIQYQVYDITAMLRLGKNAAGIMLGNGWYNAFNPNFLKAKDKRDLEVIAQIEIEYSNGSKKIIKTNNSWKSSIGAIQRSEIFDGEIYDARLEKAGWNEQDYNDVDWENVTVTQTKKKHLVSTISEPVRRIAEITPLDIIHTPEGDIVFDMGQNMVGWCRIQLECPRGTTIKLRHAEVLDQNGNFYTTNLRTAKQEIIYICKGEGTEVYEPHFTFQGFRYVAISGYPKAVTKNILTGIVIHSDLKKTGSFTCNNVLINQLQHNIVWGQKGNFLDVPTDCPQRNERLGWTGDVQVFAPTACFNMQCGAFYSKWLKDLVVEQHEDGAIPWVIPNVMGRGAAHGWGDAAVIVPWNLYLYYGDKRILREQYKSMRAWGEFMCSQAGSTYLWNPSETQFGDWLAYATTQADYPGATTDKDLTATAYFYYSTKLLQRIAEILNISKDASEYNLLAEKIKQAFNKEFVTPNGRLSSNTQTAYVLALSFGLLPREFEKNAAERLARDVRKFDHITTGFLGTSNICHVLSKFGYLEEAYRLLYRKEYPSWLYPVTKRATTIWERWDGIKPDGTFQTPEMNSFNHYTYGSIGDWLYKVVAGINPESKISGYKNIVIQPHPGSTMNNVKAFHESLYGTIISEWEIKDNTMCLTVEIPPNTSAEVYIPTTGNILRINDEIKNYQGIITQPGLKYHFLKIEIGSGRYIFNTEYHECPLKIES